MYQGKSIQVTVHQEDRIAELCFDREGESINKFAPAPCVSWARPLLRWPLPKTCRA